MRPRLGQNFLFQPEWQRRVAEAVPADPQARLLEIGGGQGHLSALLAERAGHLTVVELDRSLAEGLRRRFAGQERITVVEADILGIDLGGYDRVAGNLPYYITAPILFRLFQAAEWLRDATLMVQREVGARIVAMPGSRDHGLLSVATRLFCRPRKLFDLPAGAFRPAPKVQSSLLRLEFAPQAQQLGIDAEAFLGFLRQAFGQKRKRIANSLSGWPKSEVQQAMDAAGIEAQARAEELALERLAALYRGLRKQPQ